MVIAISGSESYHGNSSQCVLQLTLSAVELLLNSCKTSSQLLASIYKEWKSIPLVLDGSNKIIKLINSVNKAKSNVQFSQPVKEECISKVVKIGGIIIFHLTSFEISHIRHTV